MQDSENFRNKGLSKFLVREKTCSRKDVQTCTKKLRNLQCLKAVMLMRNEETFSTKGLIQVSCDIKNLCTKRYINVHKNKVRNV